MATTKSKKTMYMAKVAGIVIEVSKPVYDLMVEEDQKYMESLKSLPKYTNLFDE